MMRRLAVGVASSLGATSCKVAAIPKKTLAKVGERVLKGLGGVAASAVGAVGCGLLGYSAGGASNVCLAEAAVDDNGYDSMNALKTQDDLKKDEDLEEKDEFGNAISKHNPGKFENVSKEAKEVLALDLTDGARLMGQFPIIQSQQKILMHSHTIWMGTNFLGPEKGFYEFQAMLQAGKFVMTGGMDSMWRLQGRVVKMMAKSMVIRAQFQLCPDGKTPDDLRLRGDYTGSDFSVNGELLAGMSNGAAGIEQLSGSYLKTLTPQLAVGAQLTILPAYLIAPLAIAARYKESENETWSMTLANVQNKLNMNLSYARKVDDNYTLATETLIGFQKVWSCVGLKYDFKNDFKSRYAALFDTDLNTSMTFSEEVLPAIRAGYCAQYQHKKNEYTFGMSLMVGDG
mmetsp:Transcript_19971/g.38699  ORF Transcript_19971/g.38699 Transcript_19971/m.38699 type:complete len:400 (-) Transcript_19971:180-1379(-)